MYCMHTHVVVQGSLDLITVSATLANDLPLCYFAACNRTYYGEVGRTYELEVKRPNEKQLPFLCFLNFTAGGKVFGELVQVRIVNFLTQN